MTSQVGHNTFGSNFSTNFRKLTFYVFSKNPGFLVHDTTKNTLVIINSPINTIKRAFESITIEYDPKYISYLEKRKAT